MQKTHLSLYYLAAYLLLLGFAMLLIPTQTLKFLLSNGSYGEVFPRLSGMLLAGLGMTIAGIILTRSEALYPATLGVRAFFLACLVIFYTTTRDPFFLVVFGIVVLGVVMTLFSLLSDRGHPSGKLT